MLCAKLLNKLRMGSSVIGFGLDGVLEVGRSGGGEDIAVAIVSVDAEAVAAGGAEAAGIDDSDNDGAPVASGLSKEVGSPLGASAGGLG